MGTASTVIHTGVLALEPHTTLALFLALALGFSRMSTRFRRPRRVTHALRAPYQFLALCFLLFLFSSLSRFTLSFYLLQNTGYLAFPRTPLVQTPAARF